MQRMLSLALAELLQLQTIRRGATIFRRDVVMLFAAGAFERQYWSDVFSHLISILAEPRTGFEPVTSSLPWMRSTD